MYAEELDEKNKIKPRNKVVKGEGEILEKAYFTGAPGSRSTVGWASPLYEYAPANGCSQHPCINRPNNTAFQQ
jgi:hypothetical protein